MNYPIPFVQGNIAAFIANSTGVLGSYTKPIDALTYITVDYTKLVPAVIVAAYNFRIMPGGEPQLVVSAPSLTTNLLAFTIKGGIDGRSYAVTINARLSDGEVRSDVLTINMLSEDNDGSNAIFNPPPVNNALTSPDGSLYVNTAPRYFISATAPVNARLMDQWWNTSDQKHYFYITDGTTPFWSLT